MKTSSRLQVLTMQLALLLIRSCAFVNPTSKNCVQIRSKLYAEQMDFSRREIVRNSLAALTFLSGISPLPSFAEVIDETNNFAMDGSAYVVPDLPSLSNIQSEQKVISNQEATDEVKIVIPISKLQSASLGVELADVEFRTNRRVYVKSVLGSSLAAQYNIKPNLILVNINGQSAERTNAKGVAQMIAQVKQSNASELTLTFRDDTFQNQLKNLSSSDPNGVTTQLAPAGDNTQRNPDGSVRSGYTETSQEDQKITVSELIPPKMCKRQADVDDLMEISYVGRILETGDIFDGSAITIDGSGIAGRGNDVSIYFVLGKQPFGQFPPAFDVGLSGMCVGERRRVVVPSVLAYGNNGLPRRKIPPNATLVYDVSLVSLNGLATP